MRSQIQGKYPPLRLTATPQSPHALALAPKDVLGQELARGLDLAEGATEAEGLEGVGAGLLTLHLVGLVFLALCLAPMAMVKALCLIHVLPLLKLLLVALLPQAQAQVLLLKLKLSCALST